MSDIDQVMSQAIGDGVFPSAQLLVARGGKVVHHAAYGNATLETIYDVASLTKPISTATLAMLLTEGNPPVPLFPPEAPARLRRRRTSLWLGLLGGDQPLAEKKGGKRSILIDDPISKYLSVPPDKKGILIRHLLNHSSGLPAWQPYYQIVPADDVATPRGKEQIISAALNEPLVSEIGWQSIYSDIGFILLGEVVEHVAGRSLDRLFDEWVARPLGLDNTFFIPIGRRAKDEGRSLAPSEVEGLARTSDERRAASDESSLVPRPSSLVFAPTEHCPWRKRVMQGQVHDQNAYAMGGVAGHAGLFSTTTDINKFVSEFVACYRGKGSFLPKEVVHQFISFPLPSSFVPRPSSLVPPAFATRLRQGYGGREASAGKRPSSLLLPPPEGSTWLLGWDRPYHPVSQAGQYFSQESIGHLGYTGCSLWIDLKNDFWVILLTNRIHPVSTNEKIRVFRPMLYDLIITDMGLLEKSV